MSNCFKGDFKVTTQSLMGKAELKKLHSMLCTEFPLLTKKMIEKVLSSKEDINILKCSKKCRTRRGRGAKARAAAMAYS